jgi:hypothetical protein
LGSVPREATEILSNIQGSPFKLESLVSDADGRDIGRSRLANKLREAQKRENTEPEDNYDMIEFAEESLAIGREQEALLRFDLFGMHDRCQELFDLLKELYIRKFDTLRGELLL